MQPSGSRKHAQNWRCSRPWSDNNHMICMTCQRRNVFKTLSQAAAKAAGDRLRRVGALRTADQWSARAIVCEQCPVRHLRGGVTYCGRPLLTQITRSPRDGCGCPVAAKAKDPSEHCPLDARHQPARVRGILCNCKWCARNGERR